MTSTCSCNVEFQTLAPQQPFQFKISSTIFSKKNSLIGYHVKKVHMIDSSTLSFMRSKNVLVDCATNCELSISLFLCQTCQPTAALSRPTADSDDVSLSSSKAPIGKGFHGFTRYMLSNDACGLCRVDIGEGKGSFAREIFAAANGSRSRNVYDGILVATGLSYVTIYLFPADANIRKILWQPIRTPLPDSATNQQDSAIQQSKGKRAIQLVRQESQQSLTAAISTSNLHRHGMVGVQRMLPGGRASFLQGVNEHSNIHARDLSLLHQSEESNLPFTADAPAIQNSDSMMLEYTASDYYADSNLSRSIAPTNGTMFSQVFRKPSPATMIIDEPSRSTPLIVSRKSSEKSDAESTMSTHEMKKYSPKSSKQSSTSSLLHLDTQTQKPHFSSSTDNLLSMLPPTGFTPAESNITKSPFAQLLSEKGDKRHVEENEGTESTIDDDEIRRMALLTDTDMMGENPGTSSNKLTLLQLSNESADIDANVSPADTTNSFQEELPTGPIDLFSPVEKKYKVLANEVQTVLFRCIEKDELSVLQSREQLLSYYRNIVDSSSSNGKIIKKFNSSGTSKKDNKASSSFNVALDGFQKLLSVLSVVHKGRLGTDGNSIMNICKVCLLEIYLIFAVGGIFSSDTRLTKVEKISLRKLFVSTTSSALSRLNLAVGSPSIAQVQIQTVFAGIFPKNISSIVQQNSQMDVSLMLSPPSLSSNTIMQILVDDLKSRYDAMREPTLYGEIWKIVGQEVSLYDAAMKSLSPTPQKAPAPSIIMEPLHQTSQAVVSEGSVNQLIFELAVSYDETAVPLVSEESSNKGLISSNIVAKAIPPPPPPQPMLNNTLKRTNTLVGDKQRLGYHTNRRQKTVTIIPSQIQTVQPPSITNSGASGAASRGLPLTRSHSTVNQLHQSLGTSLGSVNNTGTIVSGGSLLNAVISGASGASTNNGSSLLGGIAAKLRASAANPSAIVGIAANTDDNKPITHIASGHGRVPKRTRSLQPQASLEKKYNLASPSPKRRKASVDLNDITTNAFSLLTPVLGQIPAATALGSASFHSPTSSSTATIGMSSSLQSSTTGQIDAPDFFDEVNHRTPQQNYTKTSLKNQKILSSPVSSLRY